MQDAGGGTGFSSSSNRRSSPEGSYSRLSTHDNSEPSPYPSDRSTSHPYDFDYEAGVNRNGYIGTSASGESSSKGNALTNAISTATRLRGGKQKLLWLTAAACLIYLVHTIRSPENDGHSWHPHLSNSPASSFSDENDLDFYDPPPSTPHTTSSSDPTPEVVTPPSEIDVTEFIQPRRKIPPTSPDPWASVTSPSFKGREYLSRERFGSDSTGWKLGRDPPISKGYGTPPPARYLLKALEYAKKAIGKDWESLEMGKGSEWDKRTGRVKIVERKWLKANDRAKLSIQADYKVGELGSGTVRGEKEMDRVQAREEEVVKKDGSEKEFAKREEERMERRDWVKRAFLHAWQGYKDHAWGHDELAPVSNLWTDNYNGWGATIVDNLDTLLIMNLSHEYNLARKHVSDIDFTYLVPSSSHFFSTRLPPLSSLDLTPDPSIDYKNLPEYVDDDEEQDSSKKWINLRLKGSNSPFSPTTIPLFETTIRYLGGLISAYDLSGDPLMLQRAKELGDWLLPSLNTDWGLAVPRYKIGSNPDGKTNGGRAVLAEVGSLGMEFIRLSMITSDETYFRAVQRSMDTLETRFQDNGPVRSSNGKVRGRLGSLLPSHVNPNQPGMVQGEYTFGGLADSYYEYLIKQAQMTSFSNPQFERMYEKAIDSAYEYLIRPVESVPGREQDLITIGTVNWGSYRHELQHLTCFAGGMLGLGAKLMNRPRDLETAQNFTEACVWVYESSATGIGGEQTTFYDKNDASRFVAVNKQDGTTIQQPRGDPKGVRTANRRQIGRPETIESVFYMWRLTGDRKWQDKGWTMFVNWVEHSITESGFATVGDVNKVPVKKEDSMESFVTAETLKYYYLLFSPRDFISLDDFVFNTEAHPFLIPKSSSSSPSKSLNGDRPELLWTGPEPELEQQGGFVEQIGEGTWVQKWSRVLQASKLASTFRNEALNLKQKGGGWFGGLVRGGNKEKEKERETEKEKERERVKFRKPIRPTEEEMERARKGDAVIAAGGLGARQRVVEEAQIVA
ncbi:hypothetical protein JCM5350_001929 [Sporobolomyces pararoseus]